MIVTLLEWGNVIALVIVAIALSLDAWQFWKAAPIDLGAWLITFATAGAALIIWINAVMAVFRAVLS